MLPLSSIRFLFWGNLRFTNVTSGYLSGANHAETVDTSEKGAAAHIAGVLLSPTWVEKYSAGADICPHGYAACDYSCAKIWGLHGTPDTAIVLENASVIQFHSPYAFRGKLRQFQVSTCVSNLSVQHCVLRDVKNKWGSNFPTCSLW